MKNDFLRVDLGDLISSSRKLKRWTVREFIQRLERTGQKSLSPTYVTKVEQHGEIPAPELILRMADVLSLNREQLLAAGKQAKLDRFGKSLDEKYSKALSRYSERKG